MAIPSYYRLGAEEQNTDSKLVRWTRRLGTFQSLRGVREKWNPHKNDTPHRLLVKLASSANDAWTTVQAGVDFGQGEPEDAPKGKKKVFVQHDSIPPDYLWVYWNNTWI